jgi:hypothetical protein
MTFNTSRWQEYEFVCNLRDNAPLAALNALRPVSPNFSCLANHIAFQ